MLAQAHLVSRPGQRRRIVANNGLLQGAYSLAHHLVSGPRGGGSESGVTSVSIIKCLDQRHLSQPIATNVSVSRQYFGCGIVVLWRRQRRAGGLKILVASPPTPGGRITELGC